MSLTVKDFLKDVETIMKTVEELRAEFDKLADDDPICDTVQKGPGGVLQVTGDMCIPMKDIETPVPIPAIYFKVCLARIYNLALAMDEIAGDLSDKTYVVEKD